jgi:hypothetical protein
MGAVRPIQAKDMERLSRVCGMLGSDYEGERANAAAAATRILRGAGWCWSDVIERAMRSEQQTAGDRARRSSEPPRLAPHLLARWALDSAVSWTRWETEFLLNLATRPGRLSPRQAEVLRRLAERAALQEDRG